jgi:hypothetical protein
MHQDLRLFFPTLLIAAKGNATPLLINILRRP